MEEQEYILIENYLAGELSVEEKKAFENRLAKEPELKDKFETYQELSKHLEHRFQHKNERVELQRTIGQQADQHFDKKTKKSKKSIRMPWRIGIAATFLILIGLYFYQEYATPAFTDYNQYAVVSFQSRGAENDLVKQAEDAFNSHKYTEAADSFEQLLQEDDNAEYKLYSAISLVEIDQFEKADQLYLEILKGDSVFRHEALWFGALSKLKQENKKAASQLLSQIPEETDRYRSAQKLYNKLN
ncbi:MAG: hypothetical protein L0J45_05740 [Psychroflexus sp.]|nr:hypothetical protein [Psychroflexus sp.]MDN6310321.1 hypothetical protein [Psychroflexus sp.]